MKKKKPIVPQHYDAKEICPRGILTHRQFYVFLYWCKGYTHQEIGEGMYLSKHCSDQTLREVYRILKVQTDRCAMRQALVLGIICREDFLEV
jgi:DNA-binding CsgD family transcriptional regulator